MSDSGSGSDEGFSAGDSGSGTNSIFAAGGTNTRVAATTGRAAAGDEDEDEDAVVLTTRRLPAPGIYIVTLNGGPGWKVLTE
jgi:hypothetical protein